MSGGFFRGTSADQDTRFSNKQAKLMKSQKFAPELEHLVEMTKVKMDVIKPWIATRVTELLGFEDEVLINFIYGLLDRKNVNGKEVQIQLTGFMEKNTGKFMKELWILLLSAQKNASGIPQQFLDAKEEETRKKKAEADRITHEILKKKEREGRELEQDKLKKMDVEVANAVSDPISKHSLPRASSIHREEEKEADERNGSERKNRISRSPLSADRSSSPHRSTRSRSRSKSLSNSRSYSGERHRSRGISGSPQQRGHSSPDSLHRSPRNRSISPDLRYSPRRPRSPFRRRSPHSRHRSSSYSRHRSPSPVRRRSPSPVRRRSPSPMRRRLPSPSRRRSPSPYRRRLPTSYRRRSPSPYRRRSPSPVRRRSPPPMRRRSPSPLRRRSPSPVRRRSPIPVRRRSPTSYRRRSPSPLRRSPPPPPRGSPSPVRRSPFMKSPRRQRRSPVRSPRQRKWSRSPYRSQSPAYQNRRSLSRDHDIVTNGAESSRHRDTYAPQRTHRIISPVLHASEREEIEHSGEGGKQPGSLSRRAPISLRSPQRDPRDQSDTRENRIVQSPSPGKSPSPSDSSPRARRMIPSKNRRSPSPSESPVRQRRERITRDHSRSPVRQVREKATRHDNPETSRVDEELSHSREKGGYRIHSSKAMRPSPVDNSKRSPTANLRRDGYPPESDRSTGPQGRPHNIELRKKDQERRSEKASMRKDPPERLAQPTSHSSEKIEYGPGVTKGRKLSLDHFHDEQPSTRQLERDSPSTERLHKSYLKESDKPHEKKRSHSIKFEEGDQVHKKVAVQRSMKKDDQNEHNRASDSESEENKIYKSQGAAKRKPKRLDRHGSVSDDDAGFEIDERKDAKRRRKEEKKLRKEERRRRREERHRKKEERRASKLKTKSMDTVTPPSDFEKNRDVDSDSDVAVRRKPHPSDTEEAESEQKKLEIELRKKALESLRAKKGIGS